ncbi:hypothetical protein HWB51_gp047 [Mycobacterium phage Cuke]|uniref:Uncharacterized protein n=1 Tax=Mycobacterium phage Cuke TaxID=2079417 RepID=A0A2L1IWX9_9CAUD|nr:hypothetical protein HWB51_gp047 [Mycobacterium phage Cuke]AVD99665.1 hypothetical protein SEA_CUKE_47 [Mycobacterium phage Cuke]
MSAPIVLTVPGFFAPSNKYSSSVAMVLDQTDGYSDEYGDVNEYGSYAISFYGIGIEEAYNLVAEFIADTVQSFNPGVWWSEVRQLIDILGEGRNWIITTDSQGFVGAEAFTDEEEARKVFEERQTDYHVWSSQREIPKIGDDL